MPGQRDFALDTAKLHVAHQIVRHARAVDFEMPAFEHAGHGGVPGEVGANSGFVLGDPDTQGFQRLDHGQRQGARRHGHRVGQKPARHPQVVLQRAMLNDHEAFHDVLVRVLAKSQRQDEVALHHVLHAEPVTLAPVGVAAAHHRMGQRHLVVEILVRFGQLHMPGIGLGALRCAVAKVMWAPGLFGS